MMITVVSPHRDDAAFSVGLTIGLCLDLGHEVRIMNCFTDSEYCPFGNASAANSQKKAQPHVSAIRYAEDLRWSMLYKKPLELADLNLSDAPARRQCTLDEVCSLDVDENDAAVTVIRTAIEMQVTDALMLPLGIGDHVDHLTARIAALDGWPPSSPLAFYEDLPYSARPGLIAGIHLRVLGLGHGLEPAFVSDAGDTKAAVERKRQLALCYSSQIDGEIADHIARFCEQYGGRERLWANQSWRRSELSVSI